MINYSEADLFLIEKYKDFLPKKVFDAHIHITKKPSSPDVPFDPQTPADYKRDMSPLLPGVEEIRLNMMPYPARRALSQRENGLRDKSNDYAFSLVEEGCPNVVSPLIHPKDSEEFIWKLTERPGCRGLKCYAHISGEQDLESLPIDAYLPETAWVVAN